MLFERPSCGVLPAEAMPGLLREGLIGIGSLCPGVSEGVVDSYSGDGFLGDKTPGLGLDAGIGLGMYCKLALLPCPAFPPRFAPSPCAVAGVRPSLCASLPYDIIDRDLAWLLTALLGVLTSIGALCSPPLCLTAAPLTTLSDNAGLCPRFGTAPETEAERLGGPRVLPCTMEDLLLCPPAWGTPDSTLSPLPTDACAASLSRARSGGSALFLKVMMHSISSPAYTLGSLQRTKARMLDGGAGGGMLMVVVLGGYGRNAFWCGHRRSLARRTCSQSYSTKQSILEGGFVFRPRSEIALHLAMDDLQSPGPANVVVLHVPS